MRTLKPGLGMRGSRLVGLGDEASAFGEKDLGSFLN